MTAESDHEKLAKRRQAMENAITTMNDEDKQFLAELAQGFHIDQDMGRLPADLAKKLEASGVKVMRNESRGQETIRAISPTDWKNTYDILQSEGFYDTQTEESGDTPDLDMDS